MHAQIPQHSSLHKTLTLPRARSLSKTSQRVESLSFSLSLRHLARVSASVPVEDFPSCRDLRCRESLNLLLLVSVGSFWGLVVVAVPTGATTNSRTLKTPIHTNSLSLNPRTGTVLVPSSTTTQHLSLSLSLGRGLTPVLDTHPRRV